MNSRRPAVIDYPVGRGAQLWRDSEPDRLFSSMTEITPRIRNTRILGLVQAIKTEICEEPNGVSVILLSSR